MALLKSEDFERPLIGVKAMLKTKIDCWYCSTPYSVSSLGTHFQACVYCIAYERDVGYDDALSNANAKKKQNTVSVSHHY
jgi:hypothetical protein